MRQIDTPRSEIYSDIVEIFTAARRGAQGNFPKQVIAWPRWTCHGNYCKQRETNKWQPQQEFLHPAPRLTVISLSSESHVARCNSRVLVRHPAALRAPRDEGGASVVARGIIDSKATRLPSSQAESAAMWSMSLLSDRQCLPAIRLD